MATSQAPSTTTSLDRTCSSCKQSESNFQAPLQLCARCKTSFYCSRACQKADWKIHKAVCGEPADTKGVTDSNTQPTHGKLSSMESIAALLGGPFHEVVNHTYLHSFSRIDVFDRLIDSYRMRVEDDYNFRGDTNGLYNGENPLPDFRRFLDLAESRGDILPAWWSKQKRQVCERSGIDSRRWSDLNSAVKKQDIQEHYGDHLMPMKLRMLAETIYGTGVNDP